MTNCSNHQHHEHKHNHKTDDTEKSAPRQPHQLLKVVMPIRRHSLTHVASPPRASETKQSNEHHNKDKDKDKEHSHRSTHHNEKDKESGSYRENSHRSVRRHSISNQHLEAQANPAYSDDIFHQTQRGQHSKTRANSINIVTPEGSEKVQHSSWLAQMIANRFGSNKIAPHDEDKKHHHLLPTLHAPIHIVLPEHNHDHTGNSHHNSVMRMFGNYKHRNDGVEQ